MKQNVRSVLFINLLLLASCGQTNEVHYEVKKDTVKAEVAKPAKGEEKKKVTCESVAIEILESSPRYKALTDGLAERVIKNGGISVGVTLEGSPNPDRDEADALSPNYDFGLYENYEERVTITYRFTFDPAAGQLFELDPVVDSLMPIEFDRSLLPKFKEICH